MYNTKSSIAEEFIAGKVGTLVKEWNINVKFAEKRFLCLFIVYSFYGNACTEL